MGARTESHVPLEGDADEIGHGVLGQLSEFFRTGHRRRLLPVARVFAAKMSGPPLQRKSIAEPRGGGATATIGIVVVREVALATARNASVRMRLVRSSLSAAVTASNDRLLWTALCSIILVFLLFCLGLLRRVGRQREHRRMIVSRVARAGAPLPARKNGDHRRHKRRRWEPRILSKLTGTQCKLTCAFSTFPARRHIAPARRSSSGRGAP